MYKQIAVVSGKGGTGKTTVSTGLFNVLTKHLNYNAQLFDCDVEEPNCHIFIKATETARYPVCISIPYINKDRCIFCSKCKDACAFNAIVMIPKSGFIEVVEDMCHGCGACSYVCEENAITEHDKVIGSIIRHDYYDRNEFIEGRMNVGIVLQTSVIRETIKYANEESVVIFDSPPGTSCPVVATVSGSDYVIMVTEPTPFGLHDLELMAGVVNKLGKEHGVIINKAGLNYEPLYEYIKEMDIPVLGEIPYKTEYAEAYSKGELLTEMSDDVKNLMTEIAKTFIDEKAL